MFHLIHSQTGARETIRVAKVRAKTGAIDAVPWMRSGLLLLWLLACLGAGCHLGQPASASFASVVVANRSVEEIQRAATAVFTEAGYQTLASAGGNLVFEKEGTRRNQISYGGLADDSPVRERVRTEIVQLHDGTQRLQCKAYIVRHSGDAFFEEEVRLSNFRSGPYQRLLDDVARRLK